MAYQALPAAPFSGGLNLRDSYEVMQPTQAYDLLNVTFDERGGVAQRNGFSAFAPKSGTPAVIGEANTRFDSMLPFYTTGGTKQLVCGAGNRLEVYSTTGELVGSALTSGVTASPHYFVRFGGATKTVMYAANGTDPVRQWDGSAWRVPTQTTVGSNFSASATTITVASTTDFPSSGQIVIGTMTITYTGKTSTTFTGCTGVTAGGSTGDLVSRTFVPKGRFLAVTPWDNRVVNARFSNSVTGDNPSTVRFSATPAVGPDTWDSLDYVDVGPGDGEQIMGVAVFDNYLIVFKETRFFVFYGTTITAEGDPEFNYRAVEAGKGLVAPGALCVGPDGVYFLAQDGVYRTNGGYPQLVSELLNPLFVGAAPDLYSGSTVAFGSIDKARMLYHNQQVYLALPTGSGSFNNRLFVFDPRDNWWTVWDIEAAALASFKIGSSPELVFSYADGYKRIGRIQEGLTSDATKSASDSSVIYSFIKTAFNDFGSVVHKAVRESKVWGSGNIRFALNDDFGSSVRVREVALAGQFDKWQGSEGGPDTWGDGTGSDTWGRPVANKPVLVRQAVRGAYVGIEIYNSSASPGAWRVSRVIHHVRDQRVPSVTRLDGE